MSKKEVINERAINPETGKTRYVHKRLRSAYRCIKRNLPFLFTWYDHIGLGIPIPTTNWKEHSQLLKTNCEIIMA